MGLDTALIGIGEGLRGGLGAFQWMQDLDEQRARRRADDEWRAMQLAEARATHERRVRDDNRRAGEEALAFTGPGGMLAPEDAATVRAGGLGYRLGAQPLLPSRTFGLQDETGAMMSPGVSRPGGGYEVLPSAAEREQSQAQLARRRQLNATLENLPEHLRPLVELGLITDKMPTIGADDWESPESKRRREGQKRDADYADFQRRERFKKTLNPDDSDPEKSLRAEGERVYRLEMDRRKSFGFSPSEGAAHAKAATQAVSQGEDVELPVGGAPDLSAPPSFEEWFPGWRAQRTGKAPLPLPVRPAPAARSGAPLPLPVRSAEQKPTALPPSPASGLTPTGGDDAALEARARVLMNEIARLDQAGQSPAAAPLREQLKRLLEQ